MCKSSLFLIVLALSNASCSLRTELADSSFKSPSVAPNGPLNPVSTHSESPTKPMLPYLSPAGGLTTKVGEGVRLLSNFPSSEWKVISGEADISDSGLVVPRLSGKVTVGVGKNEEKAVAIIAAVSNGIAVRKLGSENGGYYSAHSSPSRFEARIFNTQSGAVEYIGRYASYISGSKEQASPFSKVDFDKESVVVVIEENCCGSELSSITDILPGSKPIVYFVKPTIHSPGETEGGSIWSLQLFSIERLDENSAEFELL